MIGLTVLFQLLLLGFSSNNLQSDYFDLKAEQLPDCFMIQREIKKAVRGENFFTNDDETGKPTKLQGIAYQDFIYYYVIWENYHYFGLPHGSGWGAERQWLLDFIKRFEKTFKNVESFLEKKAIEK